MKSIVWRPSRDLWSRTRVKKRFFRLWWNPPLIWVPQIDPCRHCIRRPEYVGRCHESATVARSSNDGRVRWASRGRCSERWGPCAAWRARGTRRALYETDSCCLCKRFCRLSEQLRPLSCTLLASRVCRGLCGRSCERSDCAWRMYSCRLLVVLQVALVLGPFKLESN